MRAPSFPSSVRSLSISLLVALASACDAPSVRPPHSIEARSASHSTNSGARTENVILVLVDGLRWQEVFSGADRTCIDAMQDDSARARVEREYWRDDRSDRRGALMPFLWSTIAHDGQVFGNVERRSSVRCANGLKFSYPGYSEMIVGFSDARIDSNAKRENPNASVLEWLAAKPAFRDRVAAVGVWDVLPSILRSNRCGFFVHAGFESLELMPMTPTASLLNELQSEIDGPWDSMPHDAFAFHAALEVLDARKPRVLWLTFGETDEWAHSGDYARYLDATRRTDAFLARLWQALQARPEYRDRTTLLVSTDHGRGNGPRWTDHGKDVDGAEQIWIAALGPDTHASGERADVGELTQGQIAATLAALVGEDWCRAEPRAAAPIADLLAPKRAR